MEEYSQTLNKAPAGWRWRQAKNIWILRRSIPTNKGSPEGGCTIAGVKAVRWDNDNLKAYNSLICHCFAIKIEPGGGCVSGFYRVFSLLLPPPRRVYSGLFFVG
jgi:hypothetical protein